MKMKLFLLGCSLGLGVANTGIAATATGSFAVTLTLEAACLVNGQLAANGMSLGTLDFGTQPATFTSLSGTLVSPPGTNGITVFCTTGLTNNVQITGSNTAPTNAATTYGTASASPRYMLLTGTPTVAITYSLYNVTTGGTPIANNTNLTGTTSPTTGTNYPIYGRVTGGGLNTAIPAGVYNDTVNVLVTY